MNNRYKLGTIFYAGLHGLIIAFILAYVVLSLIGLFQRISISIGPINIPAPDLFVGCWIIIILGMLANLIPGYRCPLTEAENRCRRQAGLPTIKDFSSHYLKANDFVFFTSAGWVLLILLALMARLLLHW